MRIKSQSYSFRLYDKDIDLFSDWLEWALSGVGLERRQRMRTRLLMEEVLLRTRDHLGEQTPVTATCNGDHLGHPRLRVEIEGAAFNPLGTVDSELGTWESSLFTAIGPAPQYSRDGGRNVLRLRLPSARMNPVFRIAIAILLGVLIGLAGNAALPAGVRQVLTDVLLTPFYLMWAHLLNSISGPIIFLTVVTALLNTRQIEERGGSSTQVIAHYFVQSILAVALALLCALPLFRLDYADLVIDKTFFYEVLDQLLGVVPSNIFEPFLTSNTSQLLFLAFVLGNILTSLGDRVESITRLMRQANVVGLQIAGWVSWLVPLFTGLFLCLELWRGHVDLIMSSWKPLVIALAISCIVIVGMGVVVSRSVGMRTHRLFAKIWKPFRTALRTGSLDKSFAETQQSCINDLGIEEGYVKVGLPQGLVLYMPASAIGTIVFTLFAARELGVHGNAAWYLSAVVMAVVVFVATPPVPGANLLAYVVLFSTLGIPDEALLDAMIYDIVFGLFASAANQAMLQMTMVRQANRLGLLHPTKD